MNWLKISQESYLGESGVAKSSKHTAKTNDISNQSQGCIKKLIEAQHAIRMHHWLTSSYSEHKALGKAYKDLDDLIDTFVEAFIGVRGKSVLSGISGLSITVGDDCTKIIDNLEAVLRNEIIKEVGSSETALLNIRDEMLSLVSRTKYLLAQTK